MRYKIENTPDGWIVNNRVFIDNNGTLWNFPHSDKPKYRDFPQHYFNLAKYLTKGN
jgi:hypothetical protein